MQSSTKIEEVFVNRMEELRWLEERYSLFLKRGIAGVLVYGVRRVGKTTLIEKFLADKEYIKIVCAGVSSAKNFFLQALDSVRSKFNLDEKIIYWEVWLRREHSEKIIFENALKFLGEVSNFINVKYTVFLDEVHLMLERIAKRVAREENTNTERALLDLLWVIKSVAEEYKVFWILTASVGWEKFRELLQFKHKESPLLGVFDRLEVGPLSDESTVELILKVNPRISQNLAESLAKISGGIPRIAIILALNAKENETAMETAIRSINMGVFDDVFDNLIRFAADVTKFSYNMIMHVVASLSGGFATTMQVADRAGINPNLANSILNELTRIGITKKLGGRPTKYLIAYPLLASWAIIRLRDIPLKDKIERALAELGLTAEAYIREIFMAYNGKTIDLRDDRRGTYMVGTASQLMFNVNKVYSKKETDEFMSNIGVKNSDIIIESPNSLVIIEVKAGIRNLTGRDIVEFIHVINELRGKISMNILPILVYYGEGTIEGPAIAQAVKENIVIITKHGIKKLAKNIGIPTI